MTTWLHKKTIPFVLTILFSVVGFGAFVNTASADIGPTILTDLNVSLTPAETLSFPSIEDIAADLTTEQAAKILSNIETDPAVAGGAPRVTAAKNTLEQAQIACDKKLGCSSAVGTTANNPVAATAFPEAVNVDTAQAALDTAIASLGLSITNARNNQNPLIESLQVKNRAAGVISDRTTAITGGVDTVSGGLAGSNQSDLGAAIPTTGLTKDQQDAIAQEKANSAPWLADDSLALTMQHQCSPLSGVIMPCIANFVYGAIYKPTAYILRGSGIIFDTMLSLSIDNSGGMVAPGFINTSWTVVRDFSNMLFIFVLLYTGIMTMFGAAEWRKVVLQVVFIALLINFSLFFTKIIIDAGNVLAVGVMSAISTTSLSAGLAAAFQPQQFLTISATTGDATGANAIVVFLIATVVTGFAAYIFFKAAILFTRRLVVFWFLMIISPFAFISTTLPKGSKFGEWLHTLIAQAFVAPVFLFFIYLIMKVISAGGGILSNFTQKGGWFEALIGPVIVATILIYALEKALEFTEGMAGSTGAAFSGLVSGAIGLAAGTATGGASMALRAGVGGAASRLMQGGSLQNLASSDSATGRFFGRQAMTLTDKAQTGTWDARGIGMVQKVAKGAGVNIGKPGEGAKGGYEGAMKRQEQADLKFAQKLKTTEEEKQKITGAPKEAEKAARTAVAEKTTAAANLEKEVSELQRSGTYQPRLADLSKVLDIARGEKAKAEEVFEKAKLETKRAEAEAKAIGATRQEVYALKAETAGRLATAAKIRKGEEPENDKDKLAKLIKEMAKKDAEAEAKVKGEEGASPEPKH